MERFDKDGRLIIPISQREKSSDQEKKVKYVITEAYCPNGCNIIDQHSPINGFPGLRIKYVRSGVD